MPCPSPQQSRPQCAGCACHGHVGEHIRPKRETQGGMLRSLLQRPPSRHEDVQGFLRRAEHGAERVDMKHAAVLPFGCVHAPHMKGWHGRVPRFGMQPQSICVEVVLTSRIPCARPPHHFFLGPRHHGAQGPHGVVAVHVERHHVRVHLGKQRPERLVVHSFGRSSDAFDPVHQALHHGVFAGKALLQFPSAFGGLEPTGTFTASTAWSKTCGMRNPSHRTSPTTSSWPRAPAFQPSTVQGENCAAFMSPKLR